MPLILRGIAALFVTVLLLFATQVRAADPQKFTVEQLDQMLAPIALFPDALLAQVLMATTYPKDVAEAANWALANRSLKGDDAVKAVQDKPWDPSVQSLVAFPQVLAMLSEKPEWVRDLGDAFLAQPGDVMDSVQFLRAKAKEAGNLSSNEQQIVTVEAAPPAPQTVVVNAPPPPTQIITIAPANPQVVFVPMYNPVQVFGPWWHPLFPPFFFPPAPVWGFGWNPVATAIWWGVGIGVTNALWGGVNWGRRDVNINVNRWNNINVNHRINSSNRNVNWNHNPGNRRGVPYRDNVTRDRVLQNNPGARQDFRGREDQRAQARATLSDRVGAENLDRDALRNIDRSQVQNRAANVDRGQIQNRAANVDRSQAQERAANVDRSQLQNRAANVDRSQAQERAANVDRSQLQNRAANADRSQLQNRNDSAARTNRDNALRGANDGRQTRQQIDRGNASQAAQRQAAQRQGAGDRQGNITRPAGGAGGAAQRLRN